MVKMGTISRLSQLIGSIEVYEQRPRKYLRFFIPRSTSKPSIRRTTSQPYVKWFPGAVVESCTVHWVDFRGCSSVFRLPLGLVSAVLVVEESGRVDSNQVVCGLLLGPWVEGSLRNTRNIACKTPLRSGFSRPAVFVPGLRSAWYRNVYRGHCGAENRTANAPQPQYAAQRLRYCAVVVI